MDTKTVNKDKTVSFGTEDNESFIVNKEGGYILTKGGKDSVQFHGKESDYTVTEKDKGIFSSTNELVVTNKNSGRSTKIIYPREQAAPEIKFASDSESTKDTTTTEMEKEKTLPTYPDYNGLFPQYSEGDRATFTNLHKPKVTFVGEYDGKEWHVVNDDNTLGSKIFPPSGHGGAVANNYATIEGEPDPTSAEGSSDNEDFVVNHEGGFIVTGGGKDSVQFNGKESDYEVSRGGTYSGHRSGRQSILSVTNKIDGARTTIVYPFGGPAPEIKFSQASPAPYSAFNIYEKGDPATFDALSGPNKQLVGVYDGQGGWHLRNDDGSTGPKLILHGHPHVHAEVTPVPYSSTTSYQAGDLATFTDVNNPGKNLIGIADGQGGWNLRQRGAAGAKLTLQPMGTSASAKITPDPYDKEKDYLPGDLATFTSFSNPNDKLVGVSDGQGGWHLRNDDGSVGAKLTTHGSQAAVNIFDMDNSS